MRQPQLQPQPPRARDTAIRGQLDEGIRRLKWRYNVERFLAYFQPATNTYAPVERLRPSYEQALDASASRRPGDRHSARLRARRRARSACERFAGRTYVSVEYGLQTMHDRSLDWMNRGHHHDAFVDAVERSRGPRL